MKPRRILDENESRFRLILYRAGRNWASERVRGRFAGLAVASVSRSPNFGDNAPESSLPRRCVAWSYSDAFAVRYEDRPNVARYCGDVGGRRFEIRPDDAGSQPTPQ